MTVGTVMEQTHLPLSVWFSAAYLLVKEAEGTTAKQFQRQLCLRRYETAFRLLHRLRLRMVHPDAGTFGTTASCSCVAVHTASLSPEAGGTHPRVIVGAAMEFHRRAETTAGGTARFPGGLKLQVMSNRGGKALCDFVERGVQVGTPILTDGWSGYRRLKALGYEHVAVRLKGAAHSGVEDLPVIHRVLADVEAWLRDCHRGVSRGHLQNYLNEFSFRFNGRSDPIGSFRKLLRYCPAADFRADRTHRGHDAAPSPVGGRTVDKRVSVNLR